MQGPVCTQWSSANATKAVVVQSKRNDEPYRKCEGKAILFESACAVERIEKNGGGT